jgi:ATP-dependent Clp endopeptidase proteolytic subunit ClpP
MSKKATVNIIGSIGSDAFSDNSLRSIMKQVENVPDATEILVNINSPGGEVSEGFAIYNYLTSQNIPVTTRGVGLVASIATVVFLAGRKRELYENSQFLIHNPWTYGEGDANTLEKKAEELRLIENQLLDFYSNHTGTDKDVLRDLMNSDKIISSSTANELKFATDILSPIKAFATIKNKTTKNETMSKIGKIFKEAFNALKANGVVLAEMVTTTDGTELEIEMAGATIAIGDSVMVNGESAEGTFELADGTTIIVVEGKITEVAKPESAMEHDDEEEKKNHAELISTLEAEIENLKQANAKLQNENSEMAKNVEVITNHLKRLKVNASIPSNAPQFNKVSSEVKAEMSVEEVKSRFKELQNKTKGKTTLAI